MHYSNAMKPDALIEWAEITALDISKDEDIKEYTPVLAYRGMSGIASATALSISLHNIGVEFEMLYVRKPGEKSHGNPHELSNIPDPDQKSLIIFVDDFLCSGLTFKDVVKVAKKVLPNNLTACAMSGATGERIHTSTRMGYFNRKNPGMFEEFVSKDGGN